MLRGCLQVEMSRWLGRDENEGGAKPAVRLVSVISTRVELVSYTLKNMSEGTECRCGESPDQVDALRLPKEKIKGFL